MTRFPRHTLFGTLAAAALLLLGPAALGCNDEPAEDNVHVGADMGSTTPEDDMSGGTEQDMAPPVEQDMAPPVEQDMAPPADDLHPIRGLTIEQEIDDCPNGEIFVSFSFAADGKHEAWGEKGGCGGIASPQTAMEPEDAAAMEALVLTDEVLMGVQGGWSCPPASAEALQVTIKVTGKDPEGGFLNEIFNATGCAEQDPALDPTYELRTQALEIGKKYAF